MLRSFFISFSLKNTYRSNGIIYSVKQIPVIKKVLPDSLYKSKALKLLAGIISVEWEIVSAFLGKAIYLFLMVLGIGSFYREVPGYNVYTHILFFLTIIGAYMNTYMFNPTNDKYYAIFLMRMDAKAYTLSNYIYSIIKVIVGFIPFVLITGIIKGVPIWICLIFPLFIAGTKLIAAWLLLRRYERTGICTNENLPGRFMWPLTGILLAAAYALPYFGMTITIYVFAAISLFVIVFGIFAAIRILKFDMYREMYQILLKEKRSGLNFDQTVKKTVEDQNRNLISQNTDIVSDKKGFDFFNELFVKRHKKVLWGPAKKTAAICFIAVTAILILFSISGELKEQANGMIVRFLPYFAFVMYIINRGTYFTQALFINCDHSMLTYSFYRKPEFILKLFKIRLLEIIKVNLLPALVIGAGLDILLYSSGETDDAANYIIMFVSVLAMSIFFSVHYLTCYYLLQPYNINTEIKSGTYKVVTSLTYIVCYMFTQIDVNALDFGIIVTAFCVLYCVIACILVYKMAHLTFKLRN